MSLQCVLRCASKYGTCALQPVTRRPESLHAWGSQDSMH